MDTPFCTDFSYDKELIDAINMSGGSPNKYELEYHGKFGQTIEQIQHISVMIRISILYTACYLSTQNVASTIPGFQGCRWCIQFLSQTITILSSIHRIIMIAIITSV